MPAAAALAAQAILTDPTRHTAMSADARLIAENDFSVTTEAAGIAAVYNQLWSTAD
jgi:mannosyltransferase